MAGLGEGLGLPGMGALGGLGEGMGGGCMSSVGMGVSLAVRGNSGAAEVGNSGQMSGHNLLGGMPHAGSMGASHMGASPFSAVSGGSSNASAHAGAYRGASVSLGGQWPGRPRSRPWQHGRPNRTCWCALWR